MSISYTSLIHPKTQIAFACAINKAVSASYVSGIAGQAYLKNGIEVFHSRRLGLMFFSKDGKDITKVVLKSLRSY